MSLRTTILTTDSEFDTIQDEWEQLLEDSDQRVFFLRWHWNRAWWRSLAPPRSQLLLVTSRDGTGRLVGLSPMYLREQRHFGFLRMREVCFLGTGTQVRTSEYVDVIARRGYEIAVAEAVAACLRERGGWDRLWCWCVPLDSAVLEHLRAQLGCRCAVTACDEAHLVDTSGSWAHTTASIPRGVDRRLRRMLGRDTSKAVRVQCLEELRPALDSLVALHEKRWRAKGQPGSLASPRCQAFLREVAHGSFERGQLGLWSLHENNRAVAALIAFVDFGTAHYFQSGFEPHSRWSLGQIMIGVAVRDCVTADGIDRFDLMSGPAPYKADWSSTRRRTLELDRGSAS